MRMYRSFLPVGQGAFYCEKFAGIRDGDDVIVIYDCGSLTSIEIVQDQIRSTFNAGQTIDAVFISHLDEDHINGIPFLLKYCKVKKIFFPLLTQENRAYMSLYNIIKCNGQKLFSASFASNPYEAISQLRLDNVPELYSVLRNTEDGADRDHDEYEGYGNDRDGIIKIRSGQNVRNIIADVNVSEIMKYNDWLFIPYNFQQDKKIKDLKDALKAKFHRNVDNRELQKIWENGNPDDRNKIKACYQKVKGSFNANSMTLYSGTAQPIKGQYAEKGIGCDYCSDRRYCCCHPKYVGCLYMGDYDASGSQKWKKLYDAYNNYWNNIGCIQIPHHGSSQNYNSELAQRDAYYVISVGTQNKYRHPHQLVLKDLLMKGHFPHLVTEDEESEFTLIIDVM